MLAEFSNCFLAAGGGKKFKTGVKDEVWSGLEELQETFVFNAIKIVFQTSKVEFSHELASHLDTLLSLDAPGILALNLGEMAKQKGLIRPA